MEIETASSIACLAPHWSRVHHLDFADSKVRPSMRRWICDPNGNDDRPDGIRMLFAYLRKIARAEGIYFPRFLWVAREERGRSGRYHIHCITAGWMNPSAYKRFWKWGGCTVRRFEPDDAIARYVCKCLGSEIESARFSRHNYLPVTWSLAGKRLTGALNSAAFSGCSETTVAPGLTKVAMDDTAIYDTAELAGKNRLTSMVE